MLLSVLDPALLVYQEDHWRSGQSHFRDRVGALALHRRLFRKYDQPIAITANLAAIVQQIFPWAAAYKSISELRDLRQFMLEELVRARYIQIAIPADDVSLNPDDLTCMYVEIEEVLAAWKELLCACAEEEGSSEFDVQVATWEHPVRQASSHSITVAVNKGGVSEALYLPLVWDETSWANRMDSQESWPDLQRCVEVYFQANSGMKSYPQCREHPIPFEWTNEFRKSVDDFCQPRMRQLLVKAIAKRVYGILDAKLHDEPLGQIRRFRVTDFWRIHYRQFEDRIVLDEFGEHNMGL